MPQLAPVEINEGLAISTLFRAALDSADSWIVGILYGKRHGMGYEASKIYLELTAEASLYAMRLVAK